MSEQPLNPDSNISFAKSGLSLGALGPLDAQRSITARQGQKAIPHCTTVAKKKYPRQDSNL